jgi:hypothetical protein
MATPASGPSAARNFPTIAKPYQSTVTVSRTFFLFFDEGSSVTEKPHLNDSRYSRRNNLGFADAQRVDDIMAGIEASAML